MARPQTYTQGQRGREAGMESVSGAGVVVTGGGSGIGAALARRFAVEEIGRAHV